MIQDILSSYELRIEEAGDLLAEKSIKLLKGLEEERDTLISELQDLFAKRHSLRRKDFQLMMQGILNYQEKRQKEVTQLLNRLQAEGRNGINGLKKIPPDRRLLDKELREIQKQIEDRVERIANVLDDFQKERDNVCACLKGLLGKADSLRIKDFKRTLKKLKEGQERNQATQLITKLTHKQEDLDKEVKEALSSLRTFQSRIGDLWQKEAMRDGDS